MATYVSLGWIPESAAAESLPKVARINAIFYGLFARGEKIYGSVDEVRRLAEDRSLPAGVRNVLQIVVYGESGDAKAFAEYARTYPCALDLLAAVESPYRIEAMRYLLARAYADKMALDPQSLARREFQDPSMFSPDLAQVVAAGWRQLFVISAQADEDTCRILARVLASLEVQTVEVCNAFRERSPLHLDIYVAALFTERKARLRDALIAKDVLQAKHVSAVAKALSAGWIAEE
ncbi:MAG: hypothetical protein H0W72_02215 [Planctomycetes bacterium]|nr:hypothetical protein [Planctomycetota bacterium]